MQDNIFLFFSRTYENDVNKKILDDRNFVIPRERLLSYIRSLITIPYLTFISFLKENPLGPITSRNITQCSSFAACEIELCQGMLALNNPGLTNTDVGHLFPKYVTSRTDTAFVKYGENQAKTGMQLGLTFDYFGYWYLSCIGYVYADLSREEKLSWLARALLRDELYSRLVCDSMAHSINLLDYMECLSSDSTKIRRYGCVEYLTSLCLQECDKNSIKHYIIKDSLQSLKKKVRTGDVEPNLKYFYGELADDNPHLPINVKRRISRGRPLTLETYKRVCLQPIFGRHIPNYGDLFIHNLSNISYLSYSDEKELFERAKAGDDAAKDAIIESVLPYVPDIVKPFLQTGIEIDDLTQEANLAIVDAFYSFCESHANIRFMTFALAYAKLHINNKVPTYCPVHISNEHYRGALKIRKGYDSFFNQNGYEPSIDDLEEILASSTNFPVDKLSDLYNSIDLNRPLFVHQYPISLLDEYSIENIPIDVDNFISLFQSPFQTLEREDCAKEIHRALIQLTQREADILIQCFGIGCPEKSPAKIGAELGMTRERARQLKEKALWRLNSSPRSKVLKTFLGSDFGTMGAARLSRGYNRDGESPEDSEINASTERPVTAMPKPVNIELYKTSSELYLSQQEKKRAETRRLYEEQEKEYRLLVRQREEEKKLLRQQKKEAQLAAISKAKPIDPDNTAAESLIRVNDITRYLQLSEEDLGAIPPTNRFHGKTWYPEELQLLKDTFYTKMPIKLISIAFGRKDSAIYAQLVKMEVISQEENPYFHPKEDMPRVTKVINRIIDNYNSFSEPDFENLIKYKAHIEKLNRAKLNGELAPHKLIFLLAIIDEVERKTSHPKYGEVVTERFAISNLLESFFNEEWSKHVHSDVFKPTIANPLIHMTYEPFYELIPFGGKNWNGLYSMKSIKDTFKGFQIDKEFVELMKNPTTRKELRKHIENLL